MNISGIFFETQTALGEKRCENFVGNALSIGKYITKKNSKNDEVVKTF